VKFYISSGSLLYFSYHVTNQNQLPTSQDIWTVGVEEFKTRG